MMESEQIAQSGSKDDVLGGCVEKNSGNDSMQTLTLALPDHLILEQILPRLPVKSLIRFKSVCKNWLSTISSDEFANSHLKFSSSCPQFLILSGDRNEEPFRFFLLPYDECNIVKDLVELEFTEDFAFTTLEIAGSCNGLVCLYLEEIDYGYFSIWNPATHEYRRIVNPDHQEFALAYGFGYASSIDDYKIVASFSPIIDGYDNLYVFSSRTDKWRRLGSLHGYYAAMALDNQTVVINDTLYWPLKYLEYWRNVKCIIGFNLVTEQLKEMPLTDWLSTYYHVDFLAIKGCLSLLCYGDRGSDVWMLKHQDDWDSWEKVFSFNKGGRLFLNFSETGKCLVRNLDQLRVIDPSNDSPGQCQGGINFSRRIKGARGYVESLISPFGTGEFDEDEVTY